jgi:hypothetical protein
MPPALAARFTVGELAVLRIVADEVRARGLCDRTLPELAARAGVCRTTAQNAIRQAAREGLLTVQRRPRPGRKNLANVLRVVSREWVTWIERSFPRAKHSPEHQNAGRQAYRDEARNRRPEKRSPATLLHDTPLTRTRQTGFKKIYATDNSEKRRACQWEAGAISRPKRNPELKGSDDKKHG